MSLPWLTSPDNLQTRTTSGPTSGNEVVPRSLGPASLRPPASVVARAVCGGQYPVRAQRLRPVARGTFLIRAAPFAARCRRRCRSGGEASPRRGIAVIANAADWLCVRKESGHRIDAALRPRLIDEACPFKYMAIFSTALSLIRLTPLSSAAAFAVRARRQERFRRPGPACSLHRKRLSHTREEDYRQRHSDHHSSLLECRSGDVPSESPRSALRAYFSLLI
jgi:hypothetical protein